MVKEILEQILSTPRPDAEKLEAEGREFREQMLKVIHVRAQA